MVYWMFRGLHLRRTRTTPLPLLHLWKASASVKCEMAYINSATEEHGIKIELKFDNVRQYYFRIHKSELYERALPAAFVNVVKKKSHIECTALELAKRNQKVGYWLRFIARCLY